MKKVFLQKTTLVFLFISNIIFAQIGYTEYRNLRDPNDQSAIKKLPTNLYTQIENSSQFKTYINNQALLDSQANRVENAQNVNVILNLDFDSESYIAPWIIYIYNEDGFLDFAFYQGSNQINIELPSGEYDFFAEFKHISNRSTFVVKEQQQISQATTIDFKPAESTNLINFKTLDHQGLSLEPGIHYPDTDTYSQIIFERVFMFLPTMQSLGLGSYITDYPIDGYEPFWNFFINDVSDRYGAYNSCIGTKFQDENYFIVFDQITDFTSSQEYANEPGELIYHEEKFEPSILGQNATKYYGFSTENTLSDDLFIGGWAITNISPINPQNPFKAYLNQYKNDSGHGIMLFPHLADHVAVLDPDYGAEAFSIKGTAVYGNLEGKLIYGSDNLGHGNISLANKYYLNTDGFLEGLTQHPKFLFSKEMNANISIGNSVPLTVTGALFAPEVSSNSFLISYKGQYNEQRESDLFATQVTLKKNGTSIFDGNYLNFLSQNLPEEGQVEIIFTNNNTRIGQMTGKNITTVSYDATLGNEPPTLQMLQFRNGEDIVTSKFTSSDTPIVRIAAGDFDYVAAEGDWNGKFDYVSGNIVEFFYSEYELNDWTEIELTENQEFFQMPAFGNYYEASLAGIQPAGNDVWYDVKVICTDADGNQQTQTISPAFKLNHTGLGLTEVTQSEVIIYPNPFTNQVNIQLPESFSNDLQIKISDLNGRTIYSTSYKNQGNKIELNTSSLPKGIYLITLKSEGKTIVKKVIKY